MVVLRYSVYNEIDRSILPPPSDILTERLRTNIRPLIGPAEPLYWLLDFFRRYVTYRVEEELVALVKDTSLNIIFTVRYAF